MLKFDEYWRAYTESYEFARTVKVEDKRPTQYIKDPNVRQYKQIHWSWIYLYTKHQWKYYLPPSYCTFNNNWNRTPLSFEFSDMWITLHDYQENATQFVVQQFDSGNRSAMVISWTWSWKTLTMLSIIKELWLSTILVVPTTTIAKWVKETFEKVIDVRIQKWAKKIELWLVTIMTHQTFNRIYDEINGKIDLLLCDELHHIPQKRIDQFNLWKWKFVCWVTATPKRKEFWIEWFKKILGNIYDTKKQALPIKVLYYDYNYSYNQKETQKAMQWLSPDSPEILRRLVINNDDRTQKLTLIIKYMMNLWKKRFIIFTDRVEHIKKMYEELSQHFDNVYEYYSETDKDKVIDSYDEWIIIGNIQCCWEWFNIPSLEVWILFVSTQRSNTVEQAVWRVRRYYWDKTHWILVDFIDELQIGVWKKKVLWWYARKKIYNEQWREVKYLLNE